MPNSSFTDQMGNEIALLKTSPKRIVSLVPSQTELLYDLGLREEVVGITKFCVHPQEWFKSKRRVGGTKDFHIDRIEALQPDLIIGNKEENVKEGIEALQQRFPVWMSDISTFEDALQMIEQVSALVGKELEGKQLLREIKEGFEELQSGFSAKEAPKVVYLIWRKPYMAAGGGTFIDEMLGICGLQNEVKYRERYPVLMLRELKDISPQLLFLSSEPYPFREKHVEELQGVLPCAKIILVDGEFFSWYGSRLLKAVPYLKSLISSL